VEWDNEETEKEETEKAESVNEKEKTVTLSDQADGSTSTTPKKS